MSEKSKKILVLRFGALGDIVHTTVIPQAIKAKYPDYEIHYCCEARYADVLKNSSDIDKIIEFDHKKRKEFSYNLEIALKLRHEHYDVIFNLTNALRNNFMTFIAAPKEKYTKLPMRSKHVVQSFYQVAKKAFPALRQPAQLQLGLDKQALEYMKERLKDLPRPLVVLSPGGETDKNRQGRIWASSNWVELGNLLHQLFGATILISGSPDEKKHHQKIASKIEGSVLFSGELPISHSMCLFSLADLFISGDSGPLHIASGVGVKTIGLFGSTNPDNVAPYGQNGLVVEPGIKCKYCWQKVCKRLRDGQKYTPCMESIKPAHIINLINKKKIFSQGNSFRYK